MQQKNINWTVVLVAAILAIAAMEIVAMIRGMNGTSLALAVGAIATLAGFSGDRLLKNKNAPGVVGPITKPSEGGP